MCICVHLCAFVSGSATVVACMHVYMSCIRVATVRPVCSWEVHGVHACLWCPHTAVPPCTCICTMNVLLLAADTAVIGCIIVWGISIVQQLLYT